MLRYIMMFVLTILMVEANAQKNSFYYFRDRQISISKDISKLHIGINPKATSTEVDMLKAKISSDIRFSNYNSELLSPLITTELSATGISDLDKLMQEYRSDNAVLYLSASYMVEPNFELAFTDKISVKLNDESDLSKLEDMSEKYGALIEANPIRKNVFYLKIPKTNNTHILDIANEIEEAGYFKYANAEKISLTQTTTSLCCFEPLFPNAWWLEQTTAPGGILEADIDACEAWALADNDGAGITVAVCDVGMELTHPDLPYSSIPGFDATYHGQSTNSMGANSLQSGIDPDPYAHGTPIGGIIAAKKNNYNTIGIAYNSQLLPVRVGVTNWNGSEVANGIDYAVQAGAEVLNFSWKIFWDQDISDAIDNAVTNGRNGKGCIVVCAAGNDGDPILVFPADEPNVLSVAGIDRCGKRFGGPGSCVNAGVNESNYGTGSYFPSSTGGPSSNYLSVCAPGTHIGTTDLTNGGYNTTDNPLDYTDFDGTSAAAPVVAGVAALILGENPCLSWHEVKNIIEITATKLPGFTYNINPNIPNGTWEEETGHGNVNAARAVDMALNIYKQNENETSSRTHTAVKHIYAGHHVTNLKGYGNYTLKAGTNNYFFANQSIELRPGFLAEYGATLYALPGYRCVSTDVHYKTTPNVLPTEQSENSQLGTINNYSLFKVYPNPATTQLFIDGITNANYSVTDAIGRILLKGKLDKSSIDISTLTPGNYIISVTGADGSKHYSKFVKE